MYIVDRGLRFVRGFLLSYGPSNLKRRFWDREYSGDKWNFADHTSGDCVYQHLDRWAANKTILDMGCGSGNTATEMAPDYRSYIGIDISQTALDKAAKRSQECGRGDKNQFVCSDFLSYVPSHPFDVILFRESLYHVPLGKVKPTLNRYSTFLKEGGVIIVRLFAGDRETNEVKSRPTAMLSIIENEFEILENRRYEQRGLPTVIVFRSKAHRQN
jgi:2-polyprenyl-3-methyl-5-hydroxy-6-metoxy-1,4-benzoquinol methylase